MKKNIVERLHDLQNKRDWYSSSTKEYNDYVDSLEQMTENYYNYTCNNDLTKASYHNEIKTFWKDWNCEYVPYKQMWKDLYSGEYTQSKHAPAPVSVSMPPLVPLPAPVSVSVSTSMPPLSSLTSESIPRYSSSSSSSSYSSSSSSDYGEYEYDYEYDYEKKKNTWNSQSHSYPSCMNKENGIITLFIEEIDRSNKPDWKCYIHFNADRFVYQFYGTRRRKTESMTHYPDIYMEFESYLSLQHFLEISLNISSHRCNVTLYAMNEIVLKTNPVFESIHKCRSKFKTELYGYDDYKLKTSKLIKILTSIQQICNVELNTDRKEQ